MNWNFVRQASGDQLSALCNQIDTLAGLQSPQQPAVFEVRHPLADIPEDKLDTVRPTAIQLHSTSEVYRIYPDLVRNRDLDVAEEIIKKYPGPQETRTVIFDKLAFNSAEPGGAMAQHLRLIPRRRDANEVVIDRLDILSGIDAIARRQHVPREGSWNQRLRPDLTLAFLFAALKWQDMEDYNQRLAAVRQLVSQALPLTVILSPVSQPDKSRYGLTAPKGERKTPRPDNHPR